MENSKIQWTDHTFNPWVGCTRVSEGCANCYAESWAGRFGKDVWGRGKPRELTSDANWRKPLRWDAEAAAAGRRARVFCASLADVMDEEVAPAWRERVWELIARTNSLDWLLLTKRPEAFQRLLPWAKSGAAPANIWLGTTCESQRRFTERVALLRDTPAAVRFLSMEPLLGPVAPRPGDLRGIDWVILGGESGPGARPFKAGWLLPIIEACREAGTAVFVKQMGSTNDVPGLKDKKGGVIDEWPEELRIREFPKAAG